MLFKKYFLILSLLPIIINLSKQPINQNQEPVPAGIRLMIYGVNQSSIIERRNQFQKELDNLDKEIKNKYEKNEVAVYDEKIAGLILIGKVERLKKGLSIKKAWLKYGYSRAEIILTTVSFFLSLIIIFIMITTFYKIKGKRISCITSHFPKNGIKKISIFAIGIFENMKNLEIVKSIDNKIDNYYSNVATNDKFEMLVKVFYSPDWYNNFLKEKSIYLYWPIIMPLVYVFINLAMSQISSFDDYCFNALKLKLNSNNSTDLIGDYQIIYQNNYYLEENYNNIKDFAINLNCNNIFCEKDGFIFYMIPTPLHNCHSTFYNRFNIVTNIMCILTNAILFFVRILTTPFEYTAIIFMLIYKLYSLIDYFWLLRKKHHLFINNEALKQYLKHLPIIRNYYFQESLPSIKKIFESVLLFISLSFVSTILSFLNTYVLEIDLLAGFNS